MAHAQKDGLPRFDRQPAPPRAPRGRHAAAALARARLGRSVALPAAGPAARPRAQRVRWRAGPARACAVLAARGRLHRLFAGRPDRCHGAVRDQPRARTRREAGPGHGAAHLVARRWPARAVRRAARVRGHGLGRDLRVAGHGFRARARQPSRRLPAPGGRGRPRLAVRGLAAAGRAAGRAGLCLQRGGHPAAAGPAHRRAGRRAHELAHGAREPAAHGVVGRAAGRAHARGHAARTAGSGAGRALACARELARLPRPRAAPADD